MAKRPDRNSSLAKMRAYLVKRRIPYDEREESGLVILSVTATGWKAYFKEDGSSTDDEAGT